MKRKALIQKGMKEAALSLMLAAGIFSPWHADTALAEESVTVTVKPADSSLVLATEEDLSAGVAELLKSAFGVTALGGETQTLEAGETMKPVVYLVSSYVVPGSADFGEGGYYLPGDYVWNIYEALDGTDIVTMPLADVYAQIDEECSKPGIIIISEEGPVSESITVTLPSASAQKKQSNTVEDAVSFERKVNGAGDVYVKATIAGTGNEMEWCKLDADGQKPEGWNSFGSGILPVSNGTVRIRYEVTEEYPVLNQYDFKLVDGYVIDEAAQAAEALIDAIGEAAYTDACKAAIDAAKAAYENLRPAQKRLVDAAKVKALQKAEAAYKALKKAAEDAAAAEAAEKLIDAIGEAAYTDACKAAIDAAKAAYEKLTDDQKKLVDAAKAEVLEKAEAAYAALKKEAEDKKTEEEKKAADQTAADAAMSAIAAIGTVEYTDAGRAAIEAARAAYDALSEGQKTLIPAEKLTILTEAEKTYAALSAAALAPKLEQKKAGKNSIGITWKEDRKATAGYRIYIKGGIYRKYTKAADTKKGVTSYTIQKVKNKKLTAGTQYEIKIVSLKKSGKKKTELTAQKLKAVTATAAPTIASASRSKNGKKLTLKWKKITGASGYEIQMSTKAKSGYRKIASVKAKTTGYTKKVSKSRTYYFRMRTYKTVDGKKFYSSWSESKKVSKMK